MGLEMLQMQNKLVENLRVEEMRVRVFFGLGVIFLYLLIGALVFVRIESPIEEYEVQAYESFRRQWTKRLGRKGIQEDEIDKLFADIRDAALNGVWREKNVTSELNWTFGKAFFFSATLISTVGYGNVSPKTPYGKVFTIVYCMIGIPLALSLISAFSMGLRAKPSAWLRERVNLRFGGSFHAKHLQLIHLLALGGFVLIFAFILPSLLFISIETDWTFIDAFFFCFVSLSTIGLGDYVPGDAPNQSLRELYKIFVTVYLIFGLCCMMVLLGTLYDLPQFNIVRYFVTRADQSSDESDARKQNDESKRMNTQNNGASGYGGDYSSGALSSSALSYPTAVPSTVNPFQSQNLAQMAHNGNYGYGNSNAANYSNPFGAANAPPTIDYNNGGGGDSVVNSNYYQY